MQTEATSALLEDLPAKEHEHSRRKLKAVLQVSDEEFKEMSKSEKKKVTKERANWD
jgi:hypothetical protein